MIGDVVGTWFAEGVCLPPRRYHGNRQGGEISTLVLPAFDTGSAKEWLEAL